MISIKNLLKSYEQKFTLKIDSLSLHEGSIIGLIGSNGAGKTTLLRLLSGLIKPDDGSIKLNELDVTQNQIKVKKHLGIIPTDSILYPKLTLLDHLNFLKSTYKIDNNTFTERTNHLFSVMNFTNEPYMRIEELSHGNQKKCLLCVALIHNPEVLLLDEPLNGVDPISARNIKEYLKHLAYNERKIILISSHIIESMEKLCDRVLIIQSGSIVDDIDVKKLQNRHVDLEEYFLKKIQSERVSD